MGEGGGGSGGVFFEVLGWDGGGWVLGGGGGLSIWGWGGGVSSLGSGAQEVRAASEATIKAWA